MQDVVGDYLTATQALFQYFGCSDHYYVRTAEKLKWCLKKDQDHCLLVLYLDNAKKEEFVVLRKKNELLVLVQQDYTLIIGIDCIKVAFVVKNSNKIDDISII